MKVTVPCRIFYSAKDGCWYVESPGFYDGIITDGDTLENAKEMAQEAIEGLVASRLHHGQDCHIPRTLSNKEGWYNVILDVMPPKCHETNVLALAAGDDYDRNTNGLFDNAEDMFAKSGERYEAVV